MIRPRLMEQVERAAKLYDEEVQWREIGRQEEIRAATAAAGDSFRHASRLREERLEILRRAGLL